MKIARMLTVFGLLVGLGGVISTGMQAFTLWQLKIGGPEYHQIELGKDLVADVLPPPLYLIEPYAVATEAMYHEELGQAAVAKLQAMRFIFETRRFFWKKSGLPDGLKAQIAGEVEKQAMLFWEVIDKKVNPAFASKDPNVRMAALDELMDVFRKHDAAARELVKASNAFLADAEAHADEKANLLTAMALAAAGISFAILAGGVVYFRRRAIKPLSGMTSYMSNLAGGDYSQEVPYAERSDEIGEMSKSVEFFRGSVLERQAARKADEARRAAEIDQERRQMAERAEEDARRRDVINQLSDGLQKLSDGDLSVRISEPFSEAYEELRSRFNASMETLSRSMTTIIEGASTVRIGASEIASAASDLAHRTEAQAATIEEAAAAVEEITTTVRSSSERAGEAARVMEATRSGAEKSASVMSSAIDAMQKIASSSSEISSIIGVIDDIAFQTNLLALNAGVEAARAGEAGKGFAVVAQEVRELAQRSANAAKEIKTLISTSGVQVQNGVGLVNETGEALSLIESQIARASHIIADIVTATREQATAISEVNASINEMDQVTQRNAAMAEETSTACSNLNGEADRLGQVVGRFQIQATPSAYGARRAA